MFRSFHNGVLLVVALAAAHSQAQDAPGVDHHQHLFSPQLAALLSSGTNAFDVLSAKDLVRLLDAGGIQRAVVLSTGYLHAAASRSLADEEARVKADNDWTAAQAAEFPKRLRAFCGVNPLKPYALAEIARCGTHAGLRGGLKLHFGNSDVQLENPQHLARMKDVFREANARGMAIVVHMRANISRQRPYGGAQGRLFLEELLPCAPDVVVQVAHMASAGPGYEDPQAHEVMAVLAAAVEKKDPRTRNLYFDVASIVHPSAKPRTAAVIAGFIRQVGVERVLYGTDAAVGDNLRPRESWAAFRALPLRDDEFARIAHNSAPYLKD
jgi:uncharacterized protein